MGLLFFVWFPEAFHVSTRACPACAREHLCLRELDGSQMRVAMMAARIAAKPRVREVVLPVLHTLLSSFHGSEHFVHSVPSALHSVQASIVLDVLPTGQHMSAPHSTQAPAFLSSMYPVLHFRHFDKGVSDSHL